MATKYRLNKTFCSAIAVYVAVTIEFTLCYILVEFEVLDIRGILTLSTRYVVGTMFRQ